MIYKTKLFGEIGIEEDKILTFKQGIIGFEHLKRFTILYDIESKDKGNISWLQSLDEPELSFPVINPFLVKQDYSPEIDDELIKELGPVTEESISVLTTICVPKDISCMSCNIKAPIVINTESRCGAQLIAQNADYPVKYYIYDMLKAKQERQKEGETC